MVVFLTDLKPGDSDSRDSFDSRLKNQCGRRPHHTQLGGFIELFTIAYSATTQFIWKRRKTTRRIKLLRVHGLVKKVAKENRYVLTSKGRQFATSLMTASHVDIKGLTELAS